MSRGFTTNDPDAVPQLTGDPRVGKGIAVTTDISREALLTQLRMRDEAIEQLQSELTAKRAECERWVAYNARLNAKLEAIREQCK